MTSEEEVRRFIRGREPGGASALTPPAPPSQISTEDDVRQFVRSRTAVAAELAPAPEPEQPGFLGRAFEFAKRMGAPGVDTFQAEPLEPAEEERLATGLAEVLPQAARGVGEAGLAAGIGLGEIAGAAERGVRGIPEKIGELGASARRMVQPGMAGLRGAPTPPPEPEPAVGERVAEGLRGAREGLRERIGEPETGLGTTAQIGGRLAGETAMFMAPVTGLRAARGARAIASEEGVRAAVRALRSGTGRRAAAEAAAPATLRGRVAETIGTGAPVDVAISAAGPEESMVGGVAEALDSETLRGVAESAPARIATDVAAGSVLGTAAELGGAGLRRLRGPQRAPEVPAPREPAGAPEPPPIREAPEPLAAGAPRAPEPSIAPREPEIAPPAEAERTLRGPEAERAPAGQPGFARVGDVGAFFRRNFTAAGDLPEPVFKRKIEKDGWTNSQLRQVRYTQRDFDKAAQQAFGRKGPTPEQLEQVDNALKGDIPAERAAAEVEVGRLEEAVEAGDEAQIAGAREALRSGRADRAQRAIESLPEPLRPVVTKMRAEIDALSRHGIEEGLFEGPLAARVGDNLGVYATRSYRAFDDPQWAEKVAPEVRNRAKGLFRSEYPDMPEEEIEGKIAALLYRKEDGPMAFLSRGKLGSKDMSLMMRRQEIHPDIRALMGEYRDPRVNYSRSVTRMAQNIANDKFLRQVREEGIGQFLHEEPIVRGDQSFHKQIAAEGSKTMEPLNGLYTTPEIERAFRDALDPAAVGGWLRNYMKANSSAKYSKTILSPMTHVRNTVGNTGFAIANGHWRAAKMGGAFRTTFADLAKRPNEELRGYFRKLQELGVVHESVRAGELQDAIRDASKAEVGVYSENVAERGLRKGLRVAEEAYQAEDNVWKVFAYENELARYRKALPDLPEAEVEQRAAEIVRNTYPTYSLVPGAVRSLRRFPLLGTFVSFPAEVARTGYNTISLALRELGDPALRKIGSERLAGLIAASLAVPAAATATRQLVGVTLDEDRDMRRFLPPWSRNSSLAYMGKGPEKWRYTDLSYTDPHSYLRKPLIALLNGEDWESRLFEATVEAASPFLSEDMVAEKLLDVSRNTRRDGRSVYNPQAPFPEKLRAVTEHVYEGFEPGFVSQGKRIGMGLTGKQTVHGRAYDPAQEAAAVFTGLRLSELDVPQALSFKARDFTRELEGANRNLNSVAYRRGEVSEGELNRAMRDAERSRKDVYETLYRDVLAAERLGVQREDVERILLSSGIARRDVMSVTEGIYQPRRVGGGFLEGLQRSAEVLSDDPDEAVERFGQRREQIGEALGQLPGEVPLEDRPPTLPQRLPEPAQRLLAPSAPLTTEQAVRDFLREQRQPQQQ